MMCGKSHGPAAGLVPPGFRSGDLRIAFAGGADSHEKHALEQGPLLLGQTLTHSPDPAEQCYDLGLR